MATLDRKNGIHDMPMREFCRPVFNFLGGRGEERGEEGAAEG